MNAVVYGHTIYYPVVALIELQVFGECPQQLEVYLVDMGYSMDFAFPKLVVSNN